MKWYIRACPNCGGALHDSEDRGWVECLMCSRSFRASQIGQEPKDEPALAAASEDQARRRVPRLGDARRGRAA